MNDFLSKICTTLKKRLQEVFKCAKTEKDKKIIYVILLFIYFAIHYVISKLITNKNILDTLIVIVTLVLTILNGILSDTKKNAVYACINIYASVLFFIGGALYIILYFTLKNIQHCHFFNPKILILNICLFLSSLLLCCFDETDEKNLKICHSLYWGLILVIYIASIC